MARGAGEPQRVSVVIAAYNVGPYVAETVKCALGQTMPTARSSSSTTGRTDDTAERLEPYLSQIRLVRQEHAGLAAARNHALRLAAANYIALLDADDIWTPTKLAGPGRDRGSPPALRDDRLRRL